MNAYVSPDRIRHRSHTKIQLFSAQISITLSGLRQLSGESVAQDFIIRQFNITTMSTISHTRFGFLRKYSIFQTFPTYTEA